MKDVNYDLWSNYLLDIIREYLDTFYPTVLELGSGNCIIAKKISSKFPDYIATDLSAAMLKHHAKNELVRVCCDMTAIPFKNKFDLILSTFDCVNYLLTKRKLLSLFKEVKNALTDSGIFTFDVSLEQNSLDFEGSYETESDYNGYHFERKSRYYSQTRIHKNIFNISDKSQIKIREIHKQKIYKFNTYFSLIEKAGLYVVECLDAFTFNNANQNCERVQFIIKIDKSKC
jgi:SAM-dependent methyltransferase